MQTTRQHSGIAPSQVAVITGGAGGLGQAIAHRLARSGVTSDAPRRKSTR